MAVVDKLGPLVITKGYGSGTTAQVSKSVTGNLRIFVYQETQNEVLIGNVSSENIGWKYDKEIIRGSSEELDKIGGHDYLLDEAVLESDFQGSVVRGCNVVSIEETINIQNEKSEVEWKVDVNSGIYSSIGKRNGFFGENYYSEICEGQVHLIKNEILLNTIKIHTYRRSESFINTVEKSFDYTINENLNSLTITDYEQIDKKEIVFVSRDQNLIYLKNFPVSNVSISGETDSYEVNAELGIIKLSEGFRKEEKVITYNCVPALECEVFFEAPRRSNISIKPFKFINSNGLIEISNEEKHVQSLVLEANKAEVNLGADSIMLTGRVFNSRNQLVDDIEVLFTGDNGKDIVFEGNLNSSRSSTNGDGKAFAFANFPIGNSSLKIDGKKVNNLNSIKLDIKGSKYLDNTLPEDITVYQLLKVDPFYGSAGIEVLISRDDITYDGGTGLSKIAHSLNIKDLNIFKANKNNLDKSFVRFKEVNGSCETTIYNRGYITSNEGLEVYKIVSIDESFIYIEGRLHFGGLVTRRLKLFSQNDAGNTNNYLQKVLYKNSNGTLEVIKPSNIRKEGQDWFLDFTEALDDNPLRAGYRIYTSQNKIFQASCTDPATGKTINSNIVKIKVNLPSYFRDRIKLQSETEESKLGVGSYILEENL